MMCFRIVMKCDANRSSANSKLKHLLSSVAKYILIRVKVYKDMKHLLLFGMKDINTCGSHRNVSAIVQLF